MEEQKQKTFEDIVKEFPKLFENDIFEIQETPANLDLMYFMCKKMDELIQSPVEFKFTQIKEKFGELRVYYIFPCVSREDPIINEVDNLIRSVEVQYDCIKEKTC